MMMTMMMTCFLTCVTGHHRNTTTTNNNNNNRPILQATLERVFLSKDQAEWARVFDGSDACVSPVLDRAQALVSPHNVQRGLFLCGGSGSGDGNGGGSDSGSGGDSGGGGGGDGVPMPAPAPRLGRTPAHVAEGGAAADSVLVQSVEEVGWGFDANAPPAAARHYY